MNLGKKEKIRKNLKTIKIYNNNKQKLKIKI